MTTRPAVVREEVRLDLLARDLVRADLSSAVSLLLDANQGLAAEAPYVEAGRVLDVPIVEEAPTILPSVNPWE